MNYFYTYLGISFHLVRLISGESSPLPKME